MKTSGKTRCLWAKTHPLLMDYHDHEWGSPVHDDQRLFEFILLESAQAGLNWLTILKKREAYRYVYDDFDRKKWPGILKQESVSCSTTRESSETGARLPHQSSMPRPSSEFRENLAAFMSIFGDL